MAKRDTVVLAILRGTNLAVRIVVPADLAEILIRQEENLEQAKTPGYVQAREAFRKQIGKDPGWLDMKNCEFRFVSQAFWADSGEEKPRKPYQARLFQEEKIPEPIQQKLF